MTKKIIYVVVALGIIAIVVFQLKSNKETTANRVYKYDKKQAINVLAITVKQESVKSDISYTGTFEPNKETKVSADIQGKITLVLVDIGSPVQKGQALIQLDNSLLKLQLQTVEIQIEGLESDLKRYTVLANADAVQGIQLEKTELGLKSAKVQKATLQEQINKTTVKAPFDGIVTAKLTEEGAFAAPGIPLLQITDISKLKFTINVPEQELSKFETSMQYTLTADVFPKTILSAKIHMIGSKANMGNSFPIQFAVNNTDDLKIKSGMFGKVLPKAIGVKNGSEEEHIIVPASCIIGTNIQPQVYIVQNGKAKLQDITISSRFQNKVLVSSGLSEGDVVITNGFINLFDGANVTVSN